MTFRVEIMVVEVVDLETKKLLHVMSWGILVVRSGTTCNNTSELSFISSLAV